jgi:phage-related protein
MPQLMLLAKVIAVVVLIPIVALIASILVVITVVGLLIAAIARAIGWFTQFAVAIGKAFWSAQMALVNTWKNIIGVFAGAEKWLFNAGKAIMTGLLNGIKNSWESTAKFLSGLGNKIKNLKGPLDKDKVLLINEGNAIMQGLNRGIQGGYGAVEKTLSGITNNIPKTVGAEINVNGNGQQATSTSTYTFGDIHIADKQTADYFFSQLNRNNELARKGLATI